MRRATRLAIGLATATAVACGARYASDDPNASHPASPDADGASTASTGTGTGTSGPGDANDASPSGESDAGADQAAPGADSGPTLAPGEIACAPDDTKTICKADQDAYCCVTISGTDSAAARTYNGGHAQCQPLDGGSCGTYVGIGDDFTKTFPQTCARPSDCPTGQVCCAVGDGSRFAKLLSGIQCETRASCDSIGRTLCSDSTACAGADSCLPETDPVLQHVYPTFCR